jgi:hypothetical protein
MRGQAPLKIYISINFLIKTVLILIISRQLLESLYINLIMYPNKKLKILTFIIYLSININVYIYIIIYVWKLSQTVLEFLFFPLRDLNPHHWYTAAPLKFTGGWLQVRFCLSLIKTSISNLVHIIYAQSQKAEKTTVKK